MFFLGIKLLNYIYMNKKIEKFLFKDGVFNWELVFKAVVVLAFVYILYLLFWQVIPTIREIQS